MKMIRMIRMIRIAPVLLAGLVTSAALAQPAPPPPKPEDFIKARQGLMRLQAFNRGPINAVVKAEGPVTDAVIANAENLADLARMASMVFFGPFKDLTTETQSGKTKAKPEIYAREAEFKGLLEKHAAETLKLAQVAKKKNVKALSSQLKVVADNCNACHDKFRAE